MGPPKRFAADAGVRGGGNHNNGDQSDRHKLMRQQFYTNNERSSLQREDRAAPAKQRRDAPASSTRPEAHFQPDSSPLADLRRGEHLLDVRLGPAALEPARVDQAGAAQLVRDHLAGRNATQPFQHDLSTLALTRDCVVQSGAHFSAPGAGPPTVGGLTAGATTSSLVVCNDSQLSLMNIQPEEFNFSDIEQVWLVKSWQEILLRVAFVAPIVLLGILGNATIIYSMCRFKPIRSKPTNIFILNMALADLLTTLVCPNAALLTDVYQFYVLGSFVCRTEGFIKITCLLVSAYSLIVLSFDWFLSVVQPCRTRISIRQAWLTLASIWLVSVVMASPLLFSRRLRERQWRDLTEVWCCELIQYTKYYWVCITFFLIYLPTFVMTIVLVVILAQMDRFEARLRRSRCADGARATPAAAFRPASSAAGVARSSSFSIAMDSLNQTANSASAAHSAGRASRTDSLGIPPPHNSSLSISMKYRRRIVKILFFYLLTSIVCWTPLQFTIIYRHFRSEAVPAGWFFELSFFSQLCASLSAAMNPVIFGFLSQHFRRIVVQSWFFRLLDKLWSNKGAARPPAQARGFNQGPRNNGQEGGRQVAPGERPIALVSPQVRMSRANFQSPAGTKATSTRNDLEQTPKLTIDYIDHQHLQRQCSIASKSQARRQQRQTRQSRPKSAGVEESRTQRRPVQARCRESSVQRSQSAAIKGGKRGEAKRSSQSDGKVLATEAAGRSNGLGADNKAFVNGDEEMDGSRDGGNATTSFMKRNGVSQAE